MEYYSYIWWMAGFILLIIIALMSMQRVPQGMEYTVERVGRYRRKITPGMNLIIPFAERVKYRVDMREQVTEVPTQAVITKDNVTIKVTAVAYYQVFASEKAVYEVKDYDSAVFNVIKSNIRAAAGSLKMDDLLSKREELAAAMLEDSDYATQRWGIKVNNIRITDLSPPTDLLEAMAQEMKAERERRAIIARAQGDSQAQVLDAKAKKEARLQALKAEEAEKILKIRLNEKERRLKAQVEKIIAEWEHDIRLQFEEKEKVMKARVENEIKDLDMKRSHEKIRGEGDAWRDAAEQRAEGITLLAEAKAKSIKMISTSVCQQNQSQTLNYLIAEKYVEALKGITTAGNQRLVMMPLEASPMIGAMGGLGEIIRNALQPQGGPAGSTSSSTVSALDDQSGESQLDDAGMDESAPNVEDGLTEADGDAEWTSPATPSMEMESVLGKDAADPALQPLKEPDGS